MKTYKIDIGTNLTELSKEIAGEVLFLNGLYEVEIRKPKRTNRQNRTIHAIFKEASDQLEAIGFMVNFGTFEMQPNEHIIKEFFKGAFLGGQSTASVTTKVLAEALTKFINSVNNKLIKAGIPKEQLIYVKSKELENLLNKT